MIIEQGCIKWIKSKDIYNVTKYLHARCPFEGIYVSKKSWKIMVSTKIL